MKDRRPLLCVIPYSVFDGKETIQLIQWIGELGGCPSNPCLLVAANNVPPDMLERVMELADPLFSQVDQIRPPYPLPDERWPRGANWLFRTAIHWIDSVGRAPFWWNEADCIPLRQGWLEALEAGYYASGKPFMGTVIDGTVINGKATGPVVNGGAIYPADTATRFAPFDFKSGEAWDIWMSRDIVPETTDSPLVHHFFGQMGLAPTFRDAHVKGEPVNVFTLEQVRPGAAVFHRSKDGTLINLLRANRERVRNSSARASFYHSGNLGDLIYALYAIKKKGGGKLLLGPEQLGTSPCDGPLVQFKYNTIKPLLDQQPYISESAYAPKHPRSASVVDLNYFRNHWNDGEIRNRTKITTLVKMHCFTLGVHEKMDEKESWLTVRKPIPTGFFCCHRSPRYRNEAFPWAMVYAELKGRLLFVGLPEEHHEFERTVGRCAYWKPLDFLELARVIAGSNGFVGNQSFPCSLALGLGKKVCQESWPHSPDCVFHRDNFLTQPFTLPQLRDWISLL